MKLPGSITFNEGQRALALALASVAGMFCGLFALGVVLIIWLGGWSPSTDAQRITVFGMVLAGLLGAMMAVIIGLLIGGPVGRFKGALGRDGASLEAEGDSDD